MSGSPTPPKRIRIRLQRMFKTKALLIHQCSFSYPSDPVPRIGSRRSLTIHLHLPIKSRIIHGSFQNSLPPGVLDKLATAEPETFKGSVSDNFVKTTRKSVKNFEIHISTLLVVWAYGDLKKNSALPWLQLSS